MRHPYLDEPGWKEKIHVITMISNPARYRSRPELYVEFEEHIRSLGGILWTVEIAYGERSYEVTKADNPFHIQLRSGGFGELSSEVWHKENALNIGISRIPKEVQYIAWIDADVRFHRHDVLAEAVHQLQGHEFIQLFSHCGDVCHEGMPVGKHQVSFCYAYVNGMDLGIEKGYSKGGAHPGYAWAARRSAINKVGGLIDFAILGSADRHMAYGLIDKIEYSAHHLIHSKYLKHLKYWQNAARQLKRNIGYVPGLLTHNWHGNKGDKTATSGDQAGKKFGRQYGSRWKILVDLNFDPESDIRKDAQGLIYLTPGNWRLRDAIRKYFRRRHEDDLYNPD